MLVCNVYVFCLFAIRSCVIVNSQGREDLDMSLNDSLTFYIPLIFPLCVTQNLKLPQHAETVYSGYNGLSTEINMAF